MKDLRNLLDFSAFKTEDEIKEHFYLIAQQLFYMYEFRFGNNQSMKITELELYIHQLKGFKDKAMSRPHSAQTTSGNFYVHRNHRNIEKFKKPSFVGLDITCGKNPNCYAGILLREAKMDDKYLSCSKIVSEIIGNKTDNIKEKSWDKFDLSRLKDLDRSSIFGSDMFLKPVAINFNMPIWVGPRKFSGDLKSKLNDHSKIEFRAVSKFASNSKKNLKEISLNYIKNSAA